MMTPAPVNTPMFLSNGAMAPIWSRWFAELEAQFNSMQATIDVLNKSVSK